MNATLQKFGYPAGLVREYRHWAVLLRPAQVTLGALVLAALSNATAFSALPPAAFTELHQVTGDIEAGLARFQPHDRINYLMLMMVDPHVHFHVLPRYAVAQQFAGGELRRCRLARSTGSQVGHRTGRGTIQLPPGQPQVLLALELKPLC